MGNLKSAKEVEAEFKKRLSIKVMRQEKLDMKEKHDFRRGELPERYNKDVVWMG